VGDARGEHCKHFVLSTEFGKLLNFSDVTHLNHAARLVVEVKFLTS